MTRFPGYIGRLVNLICREDLCDEIIGDLTEKFHDLREDHSIMRSRLLIFWEVMRYMRPHVFKTYSKPIRPMLGNHFKISFRNLVKNKVYTLINVSGLAVGIASVILLGIYIQFETSYDKFFEDHERIHRVALHRVYPTRTKDFGTSSIQVATRLKENYPQVEEAARLHRHYFQTEFSVTVGDSTQTDRQVFTETRYLFADSKFFSVFSYQFIEGDPATALDDASSVVLTRSTALKYFGRENVVGEVIEMNGPLEVTGVIEDIPDQSHIHFDVIGSTLSLGFLENAIETDNWTSPWVYTYIKLDQGVDPELFEQQLDDMVVNYGNANLSSNLGSDWREKGHAFEYFLQPLTSIHLHSQLDVEVEPNSNITYIYVLAIIAIVILLIASINFINLSIARSTERAKEVSIRKVIGSLRNHLVAQFLVESVMVSLIASILALSLLFLFIPRFNDLIGTHLNFSIFFHPITIISVIGFILLIGVLAGLYPALSITGMKPTVVLKGSFKTSKSGVILRNVLIGFQFLITVVMVSVSIVAYQQMQYLFNKNLGFDQENLMVINQAFNLGQNSEAFRNELMSIPDITSIGNVTVLPGQFHGSNVFEISDPDIPAVRVNTTSADDDYLQTMGIEVVSGRGFSPEFNDSLSVIVNRATAVAMGVEDPVGYKILGGVNNANNPQPDRTIVGMVEDFNFYSLHTPVSPYVIFNVSPTSIAFNLVLRVQTQNHVELISKIGEIWDKHSEEPLNYSFLDQDLQQQYIADRNTASLFNIFTLVAIILSCTGLFGLATYIVNQRSKEMSIRKVLGASLFHIMTVFSRDFMVLIGIAFVIGVPLSIYALNLWLENFAYHVDPGILAFAVSGVITIVLVLLTVSFHVIKIARVNPVSMLRSE